MRFWHWLGFLLLAGWLVWWVDSWQIDRLRGGSSVWFPAFRQLGIDFLGVYHPTCHWLDGGDPYIEPYGDPLGRPHVYPPVMYWYFAWCYPLSARAALAIWMILLTAFAGLGVALSLRARQALGLTKIPWPFALAAMLFATPFVFALERGNCDLALIGWVALAAWGLGRKTTVGDVAAGVAVGMAVWFKMYPAILIGGLVVLCRWRALAVSVAVAGLIGLASLPELPHYQDNVNAMLRVKVPNQRAKVMPSVHHLSSGWEPLWSGLPFGERVAGARHTTVGAFLLLAPAGAWVSWRIFRRRHAALVRPYFLWLLALATFLTPVSNDYNLVFLPLAALAVWDRRDPLAVHLAMGLMLLWWQPLALAISGPLLLVFKVAGLYAVGICLGRRALDLTGIEEAPSITLTKVKVAVIEDSILPQRGTREPAMLAGTKKEPRTQ